MSSLESSPIHYDPADWQLLNTPDAYALSKFQMDILATRLDMFACERNTPVRHVVVQPGVCATNIVGSILNGFTSIAMMLAFWLVRPIRLSNCLWNAPDEGATGALVWLGPPYDSP